MHKMGHLGRGDISIEKKGRASSVEGTAVAQLHSTVRPLSGFPTFDLSLFFPTWLPN